MEKKEIYGLSLCLQVAGPNKNGHPETGAAVGCRLFKTAIVGIGFGKGKATGVCFAW
jgi:hypothetical protein